MKLKFVPLCSPFEICFCVVSFFVDLKKFQFLAENHGL